MRLLKFFVLLMMLITGVVLIVSTSSYKPATEQNVRNIEKNSSKVLELTFDYDLDSDSQLKVLSARVINGHISQNPPPDQGYKLQFLSANGEVLKEEIIEVPNKIESVPPLEGEPVSDTPAPLTKITFIKSFIYDPHWTSVTLFDSSGSELDRFDLQNVEYINNTPRYRSIEGKDLLTRKDFDALITTHALSTNGKLDIVFIGDNYTAEQLDRFHVDVSQFSTYMLGLAPFSQHMDDIVFHYVDNISDLGCNHEANPSRLITCSNSLVYTEINNSGVPYDQIVVIYNDSVYGGSGGGGMSVAYNGPSGAEVFVHEFGHTFGFLHDEYTLIPENGPIHGYPLLNCYSGTPPAVQWEGRVALEDYTLGCLYPNWYRSSPCSIMLTLSCPYFNKISLDFLEARIQYYVDLVLTPTPSPTEEPTPTPTPKRGDANEDNIVDGKDYVIWLNYYHQETGIGAWEGDFNEDGFVDGKDYVIWLNNYER